MANSYNVEETAIIANWGQENIHRWTVYFEWHEALTTRFAFLRFHKDNMPEPFASACGVFAMK